MYIQKVDFSKSVLYNRRRKTVQMFVAGHRNGDFKILLKAKASLTGHAIAMPVGDVFFFWED